MENPLRYQSLKSENPTISSIYSANAEKLVESMAWKEGDIIMDYGCGSGQFMTEYLFPKIPINPRCICGVDISPQMIKIAHENCKNKDNIYFAIGDIMDHYQWTFKENMVNKFVAYLVLCFVEDYRAFLSKVYNFLRPGGQVGMVVPFSKAYGIPYQLMAQDKWSQYAEKHGSVVNRTTFASWTYADDVDAPTAIKESLLRSGFNIDKFDVEHKQLEYPSAKDLCDFLCTLTSALSTIPEKFHEDFKQEMIQMILKSAKTRENCVSIDWKFINFVATKP